VGWELVFQTCGTAADEKLQCGHCKLRAGSVRAISRLYKFFLRISQEQLGAVGWSHVPGAARSGQEQSAGAMHQEQPGTGLHQGKPGAVQEPCNQGKPGAAMQQEPCTRSSHEQPCTRVSQEPCTWSSQELQQCTRSSQEQPCTRVSHGGHGALIHTAHEQPGAVGCSHEPRMAATASIGQALGHEESYECGYQK
jgi:hypothetical protein